MRRLLFVLLALSICLMADDWIFHYVDRDGYEMLGSPVVRMGRMEKVADMRTKGVSGYRLTATKQGDGSWAARMSNGIYVCTPAIWGQKYTVEVVASGKGKLAIASNYTLLRFAKGGSKPQPVSEEFELSEEWKTYTAEMLCTDAAVWRAGFCVDIKGENAVADIASAKMKWQRQKQAITAYPRHIVAYPGMPLAVDFKLERDAELKVFDGVAFSDAKSTDGAFHLAPATGVAELGKEDKATRTMNTGRIGVYSEADAAAADVMISMLPEDEWRQIDSIASKIKLDRPQRILFIADSLSDFDRGLNFVDKLEFWLNLHNPHKCFIHNAGIGGNYIEWVYNCVNGKPNYRTHMYNGLLEQHWDRIFIFLGQNDTRHHYQQHANGKPDYQPVPEEKHADYLRGALKTIQQKSNAKITLISPISTDWEASGKGAKAAREKGRTYVIFGEPDRVEAYYKTVNDVAKEFGLDFMDIYNPVKALPNKSELFTPDGVHLSIKGHNYFSIKLLEYLSAH